MTLTDFLNARLDEDETASRSLDAMEPPAGRREDRQRIAREVAFKREIVRLHEQWPVRVETPPELEQVDGFDVGSIHLRMTQQIGWLTEREYRSRFGTEPPTAPMIRAMAAVYSDHPDYLDKWR